MILLIPLVIIASLFFHAARERGQPRARWVARGVAAFLIPTVLWDTVVVYSNASFWVAKTAVDYHVYYLGYVAVVLLSLGGVVTGVVLAEWTRRRMPRLAGAGVDEFDQSDQPVREP